MNRRWIWALGCGALLAAVVLCGALALLYTQGDRLLATLAGLQPTPTATARPFPTAIPATQVVPSPTASPGQTEQVEPTAAATLPPQVQRLMDNIQTQVMNLRGLRALRPVERAVLTPAQLRQTVIEDFFADYSPQESQDDVRVLSMLGLIEPDYDLYELYINLFSEQVAGYYDDDAKQMFIVQSSEFGAPEKLTYAHEYTHALQDQTFDFQGGLQYDDEICEQDTERCAAIQALVEGDASLLEEQWLRTYATQQDLRELIQYVNELDTPYYDAAPAFLRQDFLFPYTYGLDFVRQLHARGGWAAVDAAYAAVPRSTEQILHPERYPADEPLFLDVPDLAQPLGSQWRTIESNVLGEWYTRLMLDEMLPEQQAVDGAEGWGGDYYAALYNDQADQGAFVLLTVWDSKRDASEFSAAFRAYGEVRWGDAQASGGATVWQTPASYALFETSFDQTLWILAPDAATAQALRAAIAFPAPRP